ncbi:MAG: hypothetical protein CSA95_01560 [Bacteroidetes bacterium]|nr:MAG: hypothetical protein CSA95_01560 [Bacteroidota bacterium]
MMRRDKAWVVMGMIVLSTMLFSCKVSEESKLAKKEEKALAREKREDKRRIKKLRRAHFKRQTKETKAMMRRTRRESKKLNRLRGH